jgi:hypothetical protein
MTTLAKFLKEQAEEQRRQAPQLEQKRREWVGAVGNLIEKMEEWLRQADSEKVLRVDRQEVKRREEGLGTYSLPALAIELGPRRVEVIPNGRNTVGKIAIGGEQREVPVQGWMEITDGATRFALYRVVSEKGDEWYQLTDFGRRAVPFDKTSFEGILLSLLQ